MYYDGPTFVLVKALPILVLLAPALPAESMLIECVADAWYSRSNPKLEGSGQTLKLSGSGGVVLLAFRMAAIEHWKVEKAVIVLHLAAPSEAAEVSVSLTGGAWRESSIEPPTLRDTTSTTEKTKPDGWISIPVPAAMVQALVDGKASGLAISLTGAGQTFHARETSQYSPFLAVVGQGKRAGALN
jgi:hypothetical protein